MKFDVKRVQELANLCRFKLDDNQAEQTAQQLGQVLSYAEQLSHVDTEGVEPLYQVFSLENIWREDTVASSLSKEETFSNAPEEEDDYFQVPAVREG